PSAFSVFLRLHYATNVTKGAVACPIFAARCPCSLSILQSEQPESRAQVPVNLPNLQHMIRRRTKMISIRVSPDEYVKLRDACTAEGVASVSELARVAMDSILKR